MAKIQKQARLLIRRSSVSGEVPITGATNDHTEWPPLPNGELMIYKGEQFVNLADSKMWVYTDSGITEIPMMDKTTEYTPLNSQITFMNGDKLAGSSGLTFDGTDIILNGVGMSTAISAAISAEASERISLSGETVIGIPADGTYSDGIFTHFTPTTRLADAIDDIGELFLLLAPTPPSTNWSGAFSSTQPVLGTSTISARIIGSGTTISNIVTSTLTPSFSISSSVGMGSSARTRQGSFIFTIKDFDGNVIETKTIYSGSTTDSTGILRYTVGDPYFGLSGQAGFWSGVTGFSGVSFTSGSIPAGTSPRNLFFEHPAGQSRTGTTFYVDSVAPNTPAVNNLVMGTLPTMTRFISGVPSLPTSATFPITSFGIDNVCTYFYAPSPIWSLTNNGGITPMTGDINNIPSSFGGTGTVGPQTVTISNQYADNIGFTIQAKNRNNVLAGTTATFTSTTLRYDGSNESARLVSGSGNYPANGYGTAWGSNSGVSLVTNVNELQMLNGNYVYPSNNYTQWGGPNYVGLSGVRWATFNLGTFANNNAFTLNITGTNIPAVGSANFYIEVKIEGGTPFWANGNEAFSSGTFPGVGSNGIGAVSLGYSGSSNVLRRIVFGTPTYSGSIIVRIGFTGTPTFSSLTATEIV